MAGDDNILDDDFVHSFDDDLTPDVTTVLLALGGEFELTLLFEWIMQKKSNPKKPVSRADIEEQIKRWRDIAREPDLKKRAERIILREIARLAAGFPVNRLMRLSIVAWCRNRLEGKAGAPGLGQIEVAYRLKKIQQIIKDNRSSRAKTIVTAIMRELGLAERGAKHWKQEAENLWEIEAEADSEDQRVGEN